MSWWHARCMTQTDGHWELEGEICDDGMRVPENLRQLIEQQLARVSPDERKILEAASVAGAEFSAAAVAAGIEQSTRGSRRHSVRLGTTGAIPAYPEGRASGRMGRSRHAIRFLHALYQEVLYERIPASTAQPSASADWRAEEASLWRPSARDRRRTRCAL